MRIKEMKTKFWIAAIMLAASLYTTAASAEMVIGVKAGAVDYPDIDSDPGLNGSVQLAFDVLDLGFADIAVEGELSETLTEAEFHFGSANVDASLQTAGVYAALRTAGPVYVIARIGYAKTDIEFEAGGLSTSTDDEGVAKGIGIGFSMGIRMEIEYTQYEHEIDFPGTSGKGEIDYLTLGFGF
jgi:hypothetical protein